MARNERTMHATAQQVWDVLADGWLYPLWVVGATRMREVDEHWPQVGAKLHHSVGTWPLIIDDDTEVLEVVPGASIKLRAKARPGGSAEVTLRLEQLGSETRVVMEEDAVSGPGRLLPKPLRDLQLSWRNTESLRRLAFIAERRVAKTVSG